MGAVFRALSKAGERVAVKILKPDIVVKFPEYRELFSREVEAVRSLNHPNIVRVMASGIMVEGFPYMAMEWLNGSTLDHEISRCISVAKVMMLFEQIASAVAYAHNRKIIHLDLKPENIFLINQQNDCCSVKVIDFGLARVLSTYSGTTVTRFGGSLHYCSPEHFGGKVTPRSDIFSLGVMLYHMLTGVLPIGGSYIAAKQHGGPLPKLPSISTQTKNPSALLDEVVEKAIQFNPQQRYGSVEEMVSHLRSAVRSTWKAEVLMNVNQERGKIKQAVLNWLSWEFPLLAKKPARIYVDLNSLSSESTEFAVYYGFEKLVFTGRVDVVSDYYVSSSPSRIVQNVSTFLDGHDNRIIFLIFNDSVSANKAGGELLLQPELTESKQNFVTGWYNPANEVFYPVTVSPFVHSKIQDLTK